MTWPCLDLVLDPIEIFIRRTEHRHRNDNTAYIDPVVIATVINKADELQRFLTDADSAILLLHCARSLVALNEQ